MRRWILFSILILILATAAWACHQARIESRYAAQILAAAERYRVDPLLIRAVVWRESRFRADARGTRGEVGLMQIREDAAREWADAERIPPFAFEHCLEPGTNLLAGTYYLAKLLKRYGATDDPVPYALADYNAGRSNVLKWNQAAASTNSEVFLGHIGFPSTKGYVQSIRRRCRLYRFLAQFGWQNPSRK
jgi:soluble lytic murein transglycosylase